LQRIDEDPPAIGGGKVDLGEIDCYSAPHGCPA
jgi:hypothetical protein